MKRKKVERENEILDALGLRVVSGHHDGTGSTSSSTTAVLTAR